MDETKSDSYNEGYITSLDWWRLGDASSYGEVDDDRLETDPEYAKGVKAGFEAYKDSNQSYR